MSCTNFQTQNKHIKSEKISLHVMFRCDIVPWMRWFLQIKNVCIFIKFEFHRKSQHCQRTLGWTNFVNVPLKKLFPLFHLRFVVRRMMLQHVLVDPMSHILTFVSGSDSSGSNRWVNTALGQIGPNRFVTCWGQYRVRPMWFTRIRNHTVGQWCLLVPFFSEISPPPDPQPPPRTAGTTFDQFCWTDLARPHLAKLWGWGVSHNDCSEPQTRTSSGPLPWTAATIPRKDLQERK